MQVSDAAGDMSLLQAVYIGTLLIWILLTQDAPEQLISYQIIGISKHGF